MKHLEEISQMIEQIKIQFIIKEQITVYKADINININT